MPGATRGRTDPDAAGGSATCLRTGWHICCVDERTVPGPRLTRLIVRIMSAQPSEHVAALTMSLPRPDPAGTDDLRRLKKRCAMPIHALSDRQLPSSEVPSANNRQQTTKRPDRRSVRAAY